MTLSGNGEIGLKVSDGCDDLLLTRSFVTANGSSGVGIDSLGTLTGIDIVRNTIAGNGFVGIFYESADSGRIERNKVTGNAEHGIRLAVADFIKVRNNTTTANSPNDTIGSGIYVEDSSDGALVEANTSHANGAHGILVEDTDTQINDNVANRNRVLGISSVSANGSGNKAKDNGDPQQCTGVTCG